MARARLGRGRGRFEPRLGRGRRGQAGEALADLRLHLRRVEVAHRDHGHQVGPVPGLVEAAQRVARRAADHRHVADGQPVGVDRARGQRGPALTADAPADVLIGQALLLDHHAALLVDLRVGQGGVGGPVLQHVQAGLQQFPLVGRHLQHVDRLVGAGVGVDIRPELHAHALQGVDQGQLREAPGAVEEHVLDEMRQPLLPRLFHHRAGVDHQPQLGAAQRRVVALDVVGQAVVQPSHAHGRVQRQPVAGRQQGSRGRRGVLELRVGLVRRRFCHGASRAGRRLDAVGARQGHQRGKLPRRRAGCQQPGEKDHKCQPTVSHGWNLQR